MFFIPTQATVRKMLVVILLLTIFAGNTAQVLATAPAASNAHNCPKTCIYACIIGYHCGQVKIDGNFCYQCVPDQ